MNFFKSIILDDPEPPKSESPKESSTDSSVNPPDEERKSNGADQDGNADRWSFGSLVRTLTTKSESVIETYSRDLMEFGSGLRKETDIIREAASRAVKDLPASLEAGTTAAHGVLDGVLKSTAEIIAKEMQVSASDGESETPEMNRSLNSSRYSWFEAQLSGIQSDLNTFCEDPEDVEEYEKWKLKFILAERQGEIDALIGENGVLAATYGKVVPSVVDHDTFWCRYFYRVGKLELQEKVRANLVKRAISADEDDDELSWEVDDDDDEKDGEKLKGGDEAEREAASNGSSNHDEKVEVLSSGRAQLEKEVSNASVDDGFKNDVVETSERSGDRDAAMDEKETKSDEVAGVKSDEKLKSEESNKVKNNDNVGGDKDESGEVSAEVKTEEEEDMGWDEIEDMGTEDEKNVSHGERQNREVLRKQLTATEDDEDLSWDIEDDDEPVKR